MNKIFRIASLLLVILATGALVGCGGGGSGSSTPFFVVETVFSLNGFTKLDPHVAVAGTANAPGIFCTANPGGVASFNGTTDGNAQFTIANAAVGGSACSWTINRGVSANCPTPNPVGVTPINVLNGTTVNVPCNGATLFLAGPSVVNKSKPPSSISITGQGMGATYAMPQVSVYDVNQTVLLTLTATSVAPDGSALTIPAAQINLLADGSYGAVVYVKQADGTWASVGGAGIAVFTPSGNPPPPRCKPPMPCC